MQALGIASIAALLWSTVGISPARADRVSKSSVSYAADPGKGDLAVGFRLIDGKDVTAVRASDAAGDELPATWEAWKEDKSPACAWMIVVDTSNPARKATIARCAEQARSFPLGLPKQDSVALFSLARDLEMAAPFGRDSDELAKGIKKIKPVGDAALTTLIYTNLLGGLDRLKDRPEPRKAVLLLTDGKDESPSDAARVASKQKLIDAAKAEGIVIHTIGYAEKADDQKYFAGLKEISRGTEGLYFAARLGSRDLPQGSMALLRAVMHGAGTAHIDVSKLAGEVPLTLTVQTAAGSKAMIEIPADEVKKAMPPPPAPEPAPEIKPEPEPEPAPEIKPESEPDAAAEPDAGSEEEMPQWLPWAGAGGMALLILVALLMLRASRRKREEEARLAAEAVRAEEERLAEEAREAEERRQAAKDREKAQAKQAPKPLAWLEMCDAEQTRHPITISNLRIGRGQHNDFVLRNDSVSGNHCVLRRNRNGEWGVTDLESGNGVVVNGERVQQAPLRQGDLIELGEIKMRFLLKN